MKFQLMSITGIESAIASMKFTKRTWNPEWDATMRKNVQTVFDHNGFYIKGCEDKEAVEYVNKQLEILRKVGAGWGDASFDTWMHRITMNLARNKFHWNRRRGEGMKISLSDPESNPLAIGEKGTTPILFSRQYGMTSCSISRSTME